MPLAADTIVITAHAALVCGSAGAQDAAVKHAAIETIRHGYDSFIVLDGQTENTARVIGYTPTIAQTTGNAVATVGPGVVTATGQATTTYSGGAPIIGGHHGQSLTIKMFHDGDPAGANAIAARTLLGPDWQKSLSDGSRGSCL